MIVLDTSVLVAGMRSPAGASARILNRILARDIEAAASVALCLEYEAVATRSEHLGAAGLNRDQTMTLLDALIDAMKPTPIRWRLRPISPDPNDDLVLEAAFNAGAHTIVTNNPRDFERVSAQLGIRIVTPPVLLIELEQ